MLTLHNHNRTLVPASIVAVSRASASVIRVHAQPPMPPAQQSCEAGEGTPGMMPRAAQTSTASTVLFGYCDPRRRTATARTSLRCAAGDAGEPVGAPRPD